MCIYKLQFIFTSLASSGSRVIHSTARAGNRHFRVLKAVCAHTKASYKNGLLWKTLRVLNRPGWARTERQAEVVPHVELEV